MTVAAGRGALAAAGLSGRGNAVTAAAPSGVVMLEFTTQDCGLLAGVDNDVVDH